MRGRLPGRRDHKRLSTPIPVTPGGLVGDAGLTIPASTRVATNEDQVPIAVQPVDDAAYDVWEGRQMCALRIDHAYTDLSRYTDVTPLWRSRRRTGRPGCRGV